MVQNYGPEKVKTVPPAPVEDASTTVLIIDDSNEICSLLVTGIISGCAEKGRTCRVVQAGPFGMMEMMPLNFANNVFDSNILNVYTASSPKNALAVLRLPVIRRLTIVCDIMMPNDTEVGLAGLLTELSRLGLPVNLVFASSEGQNRQYVEELLTNHKAFFLEKGTSPWDKLPYALVEKSDLFQYHRLTAADYERQPLPTVVEPPPVLKRATETNPTPSPAQTSTALIEPSPVSTPRELKSSTGLLKLLKFWRGR